MQAYEVNFDALVGPTHNYAGLSLGNLASQRHRSTVSSPRDAALQGLSKMKRLHDLGVRQAVLPPQPRPLFAFLRRLGFAGSEAQILKEARAAQPRLLASACSAASMWAANAATVSPSADTADGRIHFTPANLATTLHRSLEPPATARILGQIFPDPRHFVHHPPLPAHSRFADEGAANTLRLAPGHGRPGVEVLVYGRSASDGTGPQRFPARQTRAAWEAIIRLHRLDPQRVLLVQQNPAVIDQGVFHNDVICVANETALLYHEAAFVRTAEVVARLDRLLEGRLQPMGIRSAQVSVAEAVASYLFNSQLVTLPRGGMALIAPVECRRSDAVRGCLEELLARNDTPVTAVHYLDVRQSMRNGGGPACLRLRVVLTERELAAVHPYVRFDTSLYTTLVDWVQTHYRQTLAPEDLADPTLAEESRAALSELERLLRLEILSDQDRPWL